ncbi:hypothetical protein CEXT_530161 [Caerostris extrusa]|uniref:Uncharacterized protein n=1 Tax=Caerostris extrusa TaxID=172846 RepID=A0AAV4X9J5_CAEEX|nr:hypothetical protein CEXT_530161 [Caerostris extrusa]
MKGKWGRLWENLVRKSADMESPISEEVVRNIFDRTLNPLIYGISDFSFCSSCVVIRLFVGSKCADLG